MKNKTNIITSKQMFHFIVGANMGVGILTLAEEVGRKSAQDAWISVAIGALVPLLGLFTIKLIGQRFPNMTLAEYGQRVLGKWPGRLLSLFFVIYALVYASLIAKTFIIILKIYLFPRTPAWALGLLLLLLAGYLASRDARVLGRVNELLLYESLVLFIFLIGALPKVNLSFYQPVGEAGLVNILLGSYQAVFSFLGIEILLVIYPLVQNQREYTKAGISAILFLAITYMLIVMVIIGIFGPAVLTQLRFGMLMLLKTYQFPVIERGEFFFLLFWVFVSFRPVANMYFAARYTVEKMAGINSPGWVTIFLLPVLFIIFIWPQNFEQVISWHKMMGLTGLVFIFVVPLILWVTAALRKIGGKKGYA